MRLPVLVLRQETGRFSINWGGRQIFDVQYYDVEDGNAGRNPDRFAEIIQKGRVVPYYNNLKVTTHTAN